MPVCSTSRRSRESTARKRSARPRPSSTPAPEEELTTRDLISALRAVAHGADASEILDDAGWEKMLAALLSVLLRKQIVADWEYIEELRKI